MLPFTHLLAQIDPTKIQGLGEPELMTDYSYGITWIIVGLMVTLVLLASFKTSKRNANERQ